MNGDDSRLLNERGFDRNDVVKWKNGSNRKDFNEGIIKKKTVIEWDKKKIENADVKTTVERIEYNYIV